MKRILLIFATIASATSVFAQNDCSNGNAFFTFDKGARSTEIHTLGKNPEFPFIRHLSSSDQVYTAIKKNARREDMKTTTDRFNGIMMSIGFANGIADLQAANITMATIPSGSEGNMGSGSMSDGYYKLTGDPAGYKAWKVTGPSGCYVYFLSACGNAFYPNPNAGRSACISAPVNVTSEPKEITVGATPDPMVTDKTYVYYHMRRNKGAGNARAGISDPSPSKLLLLSAKKRVEANPQTYRVTVNGPSDNVTVCTDTTTDIAANINVEKTSSFTGNYPDAKQGYTEVSKREYKRADRKMRHIEKKEAKISNITDVQVDLERE